MIRYVAIGAVVGFVVAVFVLSRQDSPPPAVNAPGPSEVVQVPAEIRSRSPLKLPESARAHGHMLFEQQVDSAAADGGP